jgi:NOL1/NOP2/fmu family ribosome biogenesis protein
MVAPGGVLVYSTCTFIPEENEQVIARFLASNPSFEPVPVKGITGMVPARPDWGGGDSRVANAARLWPHVSDAEGHFVACLRNTDGGVRYRRRESGRGGEGSAAWQRFARETMAVPLPGRIVTQGAGVFLRPEGAIDVKGLRLVRPGWALGHLKDGDRFEPDQALAEGLRPEDAKRVVELSSRSEELQRFWGGQSLERQGQEGFTLVTVDGFPMGWGYSTGKRLKNYLARYARDPSPRA